MYNVSNRTLANAYKPFDLVTNEAGDVGFIQEVNVNDSQPSAEHQIRYAVNWIIGEDKHSWFAQDDLTAHGNLLIAIAESMCHPGGDSGRYVKALFDATL